MPSANRKQYLLKSVAGGWSAYSVQGRAYQQAPADGGGGGDELVIEDWTNGLSNWSGFTNAFEITGDYPSLSTMTLRTDSTGGDYIYSTSGLPYYPSQGDTVRYQTMVSTTDVNSITSFGASNIEFSGHNILVHELGQKFELRLNNNATATVSTPINVGEVYTVEFEWADTKTARLYDGNGDFQAEVSSGQNGPTTGGIQLQRKGSGLTRSKRVVWGRFELPEVVA